MNYEQMDFHEAFEELVMQLNSMNTIDLHLLYPIIGRLCELTRIEKISSYSYANPQMEAAGRGNELIGYDSGADDIVEATSRRILTDMMNVIVCRVYMKKGAPAWDEAELRRVRLIIETTSAYISRNRIQNAVERFAFFDDDNYHNLRYFVRNLQISAQKNRLAGRVAIHFNLKHFSLVNQQVGRSAGSFVMKNFITGLEELVGDSGEVCRIGGDNFAALLDRDKLDAVLEYLSGTGVVYNVNTNDRIMVSASVGVFLIPDDFIFNDTGDILDKIISSSTAARTNGKEDIVFFSQEMIASKEKTMRIQRLFPQALAKEEFRVYYQPKIDIISGELIGAEALCRWFHDERLIPPMEFIPILEQGLDICKLDFYMLDHVCKDIKRWLAEGKPVVRVSVNLSRKHMMDIDLLEHILEIVDRNEVPHEYIEIELTETTTDVEFRDLKRVVSGLQQAGISTSVDDFGMGYSSLNLIKEIPWNVLKVDRSFLPIEEDTESSTRSVMFKYVVAMAKEMGLECIAEGVETQTQVDVLRENRCQLAQGFFFDRPLPIEDFEERLKKHHYAVSAEAVK